jgi:hypothetical protein
VRGGQSHAAMMMQERAPMQPDESPAAANPRGSRGEDHRGPQLRSTSPLKAPGSPSDSSGPPAEERMSPSRQKMSRDLDEARQWLAEALEHTSALQQQEQALKVLPCLALKTCLHSFLSKALARQHNKMMQGMHFICTKADKGSACLCCPVHRHSTLLPCMSKHVSRTSHPW